MLAKRLCGAAAILALTACASSERRPVGVLDLDEDQASLDADGDEAEDEESDPGDHHRREPIHDPTLVRQALDRTADGSDASGLGLAFAVVERPPGQPWLAAVVNRGTHTVSVLFDLRTLSFSVTPPSSSEEPPKKAPKPVSCVLPRDAVPTSAEPELEVELAPGHGLVDQFDPRLYCFSASTEGVLVPGAGVSARLGFPEKTKTVWRGGKKEQILVEQTPPFLARQVEPVLDLDGPSEPEPAAAEEAPEEHGPLAIKGLFAPDITLGQEFARMDEDGPDRSTDPLELSLVRGSDVSGVSQATITVALVNRGKTAQPVYFRRENVTFELSGPEGFTTCDPGPDGRAPDRQGISVLRAGGRVALTSRLAELCDDGTFDVPGLYLVRARFESAPEGDYGTLLPFSGRVLARKPVAVRIRHGEAELPARHAPLWVKVGTP